MPPFAILGRNVYGDGPGVKRLSGGTVIRVDRKLVVCHARCARERPGGLGLGIVSALAPWQPICS
jgi:hypothetical protein